MATERKSAGVKKERADLRRGAGQLLSGAGVRIIARVLLIVFVAKLYGVANFGRLGETVAIIELTAALATFGLNKTMLGRMASPDGTHAVQVIANAFVIAAVFSFLSSLFLWLIWPFVTSTNVDETRIAILGIPLIALSEVALTATRHHRTVVWDALVKAVVKPWGFLLLALAGYGLLTRNGGEGITQEAGEAVLILAYVLSLAIACVAAFYALFRVYGADLLRHSAMPKLRDISQFSSQSLPIAINETAAFAFRRIDIIILALAAGPEATGIYYLAQQVGTVLEKIRHLFEPMLAPIVAQGRSLDVIGDHLRRLCLMIFSAQTAILVLFAIIGGPVLGWLGAGLAGGLMVVLVVLLAELIDGSFGLTELPVVFRNPNWLPRVALTALGLEVVLIVAFSATLGAVGAAIGFAIAMALLACFRLILVKRLYGISVLNFRFLLVMLTAAIAGGAALITYRYFIDTMGMAVGLSAVLFLGIYGAGLSLFMPRQGKLPDDEGE